jgi:hypothetical protein
MWRPPLLFVLVFLLLGIDVAKAQNQVVITPGPDATRFASALGSSVDQLTTELHSHVNQLFQVVNVHSFLQDFQNAQSFSGKGLGVDYASEATLVEAGATMSLASNLDKAYEPSGSYTDPPIRGGGSNFSLMAGMGMGLFGYESLMIFGNWFKGSASIGALDGTYQNWGLHAQMRFLGPGRGLSATKFLFRWGGIAVTTGVDYSRMTLHYQRPIESKFYLGQGVPVTVHSDVNSQMAFDLDQRTWGIPLEVTTSLRLLTILTLYGGLGFDLQPGGGANLNIDMKARLGGNLNGETYTDLGTATIKVKERAVPSSVRMREILGVQLNFLLLRIFAQLNLTGGSPMLASVALGARLAY